MTLEWLTETTRGERLGLAVVPAALALVGFDAARGEFPLVGAGFAVVWASAVVALIRAGVADRRLQDTEGIVADVLDDDQEGDR